MVSEIAENSFLAEPNRAAHIVLRRVKALLVILRGNK